MNFLKMVLVGGTVVLTAGAAFAQSAELKNAHKATIAAQMCDLNLDSGKSSELGDAVQRLEQKSGLAQGELDALLTETQTAADADKDAFCKDAAKLVDDVIAAAE